MSIPKPKLIVVLGPTASGKSALAIKLAGKFNGEIVGADSRQIYKEMDIGTAKITEKEMKSIPHRLVSIAAPDEAFTLAQYKKKAVKIIKDIHQRDKIPFLVGGTGLYIQAVIDNLHIPTVPPNRKIRQKLEKLSIEELAKQLKKLDPASLSFVDLKNKRRLIRALEVCLLTGKPFSEQREKGEPLFDVLQIGIKSDPKKLLQKINTRADKMIKAGFIKEVQKLVKKYGSDLPALSGIGYQEIIPLLKKEISLKGARELIKKHTHQYARRQMTWFKKDKRIKWVRDYIEAEKLIKKFLF